MRWVLDQIARELSARKGLRSALTPRLQLGGRGPWQAALEHPGADGSGRTPVVAAVLERRFVRA